MLRERLGFGRFLGTRQKLALSGAAAISGPNATLSSTSLTFSTQAIGTTSAAKTVTLKNTGTAILTISSIAITGTNAGDFAQTHTCGIAGSGIELQHQCHVQAHGVRDSHGGTEHQRQCRWQPAKSDAKWNRDDSEALAHQLELRRSSDWHD